MLKISPPELSPITFVRYGGFFFSLENIFRFENYCLYLQADNNSTCMVPDFVHSIAAQLCQAPVLCDYKDYLLSESYLQVCAASL